MPALVEVPRQQSAMCRKSQIDAIVLRQIVRRLGHASAGKVSGRGDDSDTQVGTDAHGDHVLVHLIAQAYARVKALGYDVRHRIVDVDLDVDVRVVPQDLGQLGP
ncbi:hypothetical protein D3C72_2056480 [compost metagenome]